MMHLIIANALLSSQTACLEEKPPLDILPPQSLVFVLDNSSSMTNETASLGLNLGELWNGISATAGGDTASGAAQFADVAIGVTTLAIGGSHPGAAGSLIQPAINAQQGSIARLQLQRDILCSATCWDPHDLSNPMIHNEDYDCNPSDPTVPDEVSFEYLDCMCGEGSWETGTNCGGGDEEGLEAVFLSLCRASSSPPAECFEAPYAVLTEGASGSNEGLIQDGTEFTFLIVTDEGDGSRRLENQVSDPSPYLDLMDGFNMPYQVAVVGPYWDGESMLCNSGGATTWGSDRYQQAAETSGGFYNFISEEDGSGNCTTSEFSENLADLASLLTD